MPGADWIPVVSQIKSIVQLCAGDEDGFRKTNENFVKECPIVSQVTSVVQLIGGDADGALETQKKCLGTLNNVANGVPLIGHIKGGIHHLCGDEDGGDRAMKAANRSSVVIASGAAAGLASGAAGIAAGATYDAVSSIASDQPQGIFASLDNAVKTPNAGNIFDVVICPVADGFAGYTGGEIADSVVNRFSGNNVGGDVSGGSYPDAPSNPSAIKSLEALREVKLLEMDSAPTSAQALQIAQEINGLTKQIQGKPVQSWVDLKASHAGKINTKPIYASGCSETANAKDVETKQK
uniref:Uncharacterized protein n=1 Tax=Panagrolaimus sp. ES5 TaxID=591445 RepID=A0AC34FH74_9BILA